ncbi:alpha/beta fold hydrolase [Kangiella taiwanensis]|uniref:Homoserine O-succinyltransferase n=1 Tax=Kangiella taiwanensis TaxID=1079179 RepID=A0ABP8HZX3_9GAMM|nr:alpha/beta fold hydrolase [Kangiella taiwanensis]
MAIATTEIRNAQKTHVKAVFGAVAVKKGVTLSSGTSTEECTLKYSIYGDRTLPVVVVLGGITASRHVLHSNQETAEDCDDNSVSTGWWDDLVGDGKAIDTQKYCVISFNYISTLQFKSKANYKVVRHVTPADQACLLSELLKLLSVNEPVRFVGSSYGGMVGLNFAEQYPHKVKHLVCISASDRSTHTARAIRAIQKGIFELADTSEQKHQALSLARQLSILFYRTDDIFDTQFVDPIVQLPFDNILGYEQTIYSYLKHQGQKFANKTTISNYTALLDSIDAHRVEPNKIKCSSSFVAVPSDRLVSFESMRKLAHTVKGTSDFYRLESVYGHDAFLKEFEQLTDLLKKILGASDESPASYASR